MAAGQGRSEGPPAEPIPAEVILSDLREAYSKVTAEEVSARFRSGAGERGDTFTVRIDPGEPGSPRPRAMLLELGALRVYVGGGRLTAVSSSAPDKVFTRECPGAMTPGRLAEMIPPLLLPQLALISGDAGFATPLAHLAGVAWSDGVADETVRPPTVTMKGTSPNGSIEVISSIPTGRLQKISASFRRGETEGVLDLTFRAIDPGDPARWVIPIEGRQVVGLLSELRAAARPVGPAVIGELSPNISLHRFDMTGWTLHEGLVGAEPGTWLAVVLFKLPFQASITQDGGNEPRIAIRSLQSALQEQSGSALSPKVRCAVAAVMELKEFSRDRWAEARRQWAEALAKGGPPGAAELMWASGAPESIDRFLPGAGAVIVVVRPDRALAAAIRVDGQPDDQVKAQVRSALNPSTNAPSTK